MPGISASKDLPGLIYHQRVQGNDFCLPGVQAVHIHCLSAWDGLVFCLRRLFERGPESLISLRVEEKRLGESGAKVVWRLHEIVQ
jgi:hypothetical protein